VNIKKKCTKRIDFYMAYLKVYWKKTMAIFYQRLTVTASRGKNHIQISRNFKDMLPIWPWLGLPLTIVQYVM